MIIKLYQPPTRNWLLIAEQLDDPQGWDRFIPSHTVASERWRFDCLVKELAAGKLKIKVCKDLLKRGTSVFEYDWNDAESEILCHAMEAADRLGQDLLLGSPAGIDETNPLRAA
jgi:hypothetical protein